VRARPALAVVLASGLLAAAAPPASAQDPTCSGDLGSLPDPKPDAPRLTFGIYPGGQAGQVFGPPAEPKPDDPAQITAALGRLRGSAARPFVTHLYLSFTGTPDQERLIRAAEEQIDRHRRSGLHAELVLAYRPAARRGDADVKDFVVFTQAMVERLGPRLKAIQVMNEVNNDLSPDASDGAYPGARDALPQAILAAADQKRKLGLDDLEIGMNWFYRLTPDREFAFWSELGQKGGPELRRALSWVGLDAYPGTFFPPGSRYRESMANGMSALRECYMPLAGLGKGIPIHVSENGYPTGPGRSYEEQDRALGEMVRAVHDFRGNYNVSDYRWFDLRDGDSSNPNFQQQFGIMRDDYTPKPAFETYRRLIGELACTDSAPPVTTIARAGVRRRVLSLNGGSADPGCSTGVARVQVAIARAARNGRCRFVNARGRLTVPRPCRRPVLIDATGTAAWRVAIRLPRAGRYRVTARAVDAAGNKEPPRRGRIVKR
jgi:hypothetical protein